MTYQSTKLFGAISTGHRQPEAAEKRDSSKCAFVHGYGRMVEITFICKELDKRGWCVDYGDLKEIKEWLEEQWDHRVLINSDDPKLEEIKQMHEKGLIHINIMNRDLGYGAGIEQSCKFVCDFVDRWIKIRTEGRCSVWSVRIWEHASNSSIYIND